MISWIDSDDAQECMAKMNIGQTVLANLLDGVWEIKKEGQDLFKTTYHKRCSCSQDCAEGYECRKNSIGITTCVKKNS